MSEDCSADYLKLYEHERSRRIELERKLEKEHRSLLSLNESLVELTVNLEKKVAERTAELRAARDQALTSAKIKSDFLANISHEIRTPLNGVIGMLSAMANSEDDSQRDKLLDIALESSEQLLGILNDVLEFSKFESLGVSLEPQKTNLRKLINYTAHQFAFVAQRKHLNLRTDIDIHLPDYLYADGFRLKQVINNLVSNAIKFTAQGEVVIAAHCTNSSDIEIAVSDTGIGMDARQQSRIFRAFNQGDSSITRQFGGTGLGLTICAQIVKAMESEITIKSERNKGSCFSFTLHLPWRSDETLYTRYHGKLQHKRLAILSRDMSSVPGLCTQLEALNLTELEWYQSHDALPMPLLHDTQAYCLIDSDDFWPGEPTIARWLEQFAPSHRILLSRYHTRREIAADSVNQLFKPLRLTEFVNLLCGESGDPQKLPRGQQRHSGQTLLVVDDNSINREVIKQLLAASGCTIIEAENGAQAVSYVKQHSVDLVLMDIQMPIMDGLTATRKIRELKPRGGEIPIIAMTAHASPADVQRCQQAQMNAHLVKPIETQALWVLLKKYLGATKKSSASAATTQCALPIIDGFNLAMALQRLQGRVEVLQRLLAQFCEHYSHSSSQLRCFLQQQDWEQAMQYVHTLKGTSANLGGVKISELAARIENRLRASDRGNFSEELDELERALKVLPEIEHWLQLQEETVTCNTRVAINNREFTSTLQILEQSLEVDVGRAQEILESLQRCAGNEAQNKLVQQVCEDFYEYNLEAVRDTIRDYLQQLS